MKCNQCGAYVNIRKNYCLNCGAPIIKNKNNEKQNTNLEDTREYKIKRTQHQQVQSTFNFYKLSILITFLMLAIITLSLVMFSYCTYLARSGTSMLTTIKSIYSTLGLIYKIGLIGLVFGIVVSLIDMIKKGHKKPFIYIILICLLFGAGLFNRDILSGNWTTFNATVKVVSMNRIKVQLGVLVVLLIITYIYSFIEIVGKKKK